MSKWRWIGVGVVVVAVGAGAGVFYATRAQSSAREANPAATPPRPGARAVPVRAVTSKLGEIDQTVSAIGTVTALNTATVKARVDGPLVSVPFQEGKVVKAGELLAQIDPRTYQVALDQAKGQQLRDEAQLANAKVDLERYTILFGKDSVSKQQLDAQAALVQQLQGTIEADKAVVDNAKLQLEFTRITAPIGGRVGLRLVDVGNMVRASDATGIVVITQTQPISTVFPVPSEQLGAILSPWQKGTRLTVEAFDRDGKKRLATGWLASIDNQIDTTSGTVKLKAQFANDDNQLFPNQFVNVRLTVARLPDKTLIPSAAVQRGTPGTFVYVIGEGDIVQLRKVTLGLVSDNLVAIEDGLKPNERVVIDGADDLREGTKVDIIPDRPRGPAPGQAPGPPPGQTRERKQG